MPGGKGIRRVIELALDAVSAKRMRDQAQRALDEGTDPRRAQRNLSAAEGAMERLRGAALKIGAAFAAAFALDKIRAFGAASVRAAMEAEQGWARLGATLRSAGVDLEQQRARIEAAAQGIVAGSVFDDDAVVAGLERMTSLTGDYEGSLARLGLVSNLAADQQISFEEASERVAKIMNGGTRELKAYGLEALGAERGLAVLDERLGGRAAAQAATFSGQLQILNRDWGEFQEAVGNAMIAGTQGTTVMGTLRGVLATLTGAVQNNQEGFAAFVRNGINLTVGALEHLVNGFRFLGAALSGAIMNQIGRFVGAWSRIVDAFALAVEARAAWNRLTGDTAEARQFEAQGMALRVRAEQLRGVAEAYRDGARAVLDFERISLRGGGAGAAARSAAPAPGRPAPRLSPRAGSGGGGGRAGATPETAVLEALSGKELTGGRGMKGAEPTGTVQPNAFGPQVIIRDLEELGFAIDATKSRTDQFLEGFAVASQDAAESMTDAFGTAFATLWQEGATVSDAFQGFFQAIGQAATGALADYASKKSKENFLKSAESIADGIRAMSNPLTAPLAGGFFSAAAKYAAVGAAWGAAFGVAGGAGGAIGGGGGRSHGGYRDTGRQTVDDAKRKGPEVHIYQYVDGVDPHNPRHADRVYATYGKAKERFGDDARVTVHQLSGPPRMPGGR
jgi:hypothetical protein